MTPIEIVSIIQSLEKDLPLKNLTIDGINYWPIARIYLGFELDDNRSNGTVGTVKNSLYKRIRSRLKPYTSGLFRNSVPRDIWNRTGDRQVVFLTYTEARRIRVENGIIDGYLDPIYKKLGSQNDGFFVDYTSSKHYGGGTNLDPFGFSLSTVNASKKAFVNLLFSRKDKELDWFFDLLDQLLLRKGVTKNIDKRRLKFRILLILELVDHYSHLFKKLNARILIGSNYYGLEMAASIAAHQVGMKVVDVQHGGQGPAHHAYADWPDIGRPFEALPDVFWTWDQFSKDNIDKWGYKHSRAVVGGHTLLLSSIVERASSEMILQAIEASKKPNKPNVLVTLQKGVDVLDFIAELILKSPDKVKWWVRLHPGMMSELDNFINFFHKELGRNDVEVELASSCPLFIILLEMQLHITAFSSVLQDASIFKVPSIAIDRRAKSLFEQEYRNNEFEVNEDVCDILQKLKVISAIEVNNKSLGNILDMQNRLLVAAYSEVISY